ncbi:aspartate/glutamate racemase family protein [Pontimicrobium aquaticum]|uniref:Aspartate/glutamate racemase family protein n=1 Tax=Pontimicrobium aquaticum TaxID=2565367 RepID=A0A4U0EQL7_9FLAO|nr:aspartate/glutamate racemase family protein [Pontimicrobium aquaticum]TJY33986.1 aspartate/glutamate racemase family protein [Pontimicrobium aquaticum]
MKTIGLIGGITPQSTILYYQILNDLANKEFGGNHSCKTIIYSLDFGEIAKLQSQGDWDTLDKIMLEAGKSLEKAGADLIIICANTMHLSIEAIKSVVVIPVIHIAEATAEKIKEQQIEKVLLLGTRYTMEKDFFKVILVSNGIDVIVPNEAEQQKIHDVIYSELAKGIINDASKQIYLQIIEKLVAKGAKGVILGCTEIPLLIQQSDVLVPVFDTTNIHANAAFNSALNF